MGQLRPLFRLRDNPIPVLGLTPRCGGVDGAQQVWSCSLVGQGDSGSRDGAGGGGAHGQVGARWGPPLQLTPRANTYCTTIPFVFIANTVLTQVFLLWCLHYWVQQQFNVFYISSLNTRRNI